MRDASLLLTIAAVACIVVPWLLHACLCTKPVENSSRAIQNDPRRFGKADSIDTCPTGTPTTAGGASVSSSHAGEVRDA